METIETDYLVVGAGAAGMAFTDALIAASDADVVMLDRRHRPGGHWNDAYPFVKLHQPSAIYGVNSTMLGSDSIDEVGSDRGLYERASASEICGYFQKVMETVLLPSGRVRFFPMSDYEGDFDQNHVFRSRLTGAMIRVRVRRKVVDTTHLQVSVPATHKRPFEVDAAAQVIPPGELVRRAHPGSGYTILGGGKTAMDACSWLLQHGVTPDQIRWIRPREAWLVPRKAFQPMRLLSMAIDSFDLAMQALADATDLQDMFDRLEASGVVMRFNRRVVPTMYHGAILSPSEFDSLTSITNVVRKGHVRHIGSSRIVLEHGEIPTDTQQVHVDCTAAGVRTNPPMVPIFESNRITLQGLVGGFITFCSALTGYVEAVRDDDAEKNRILPPVSTLNNPRDWINSNRGFLHLSSLQEGAGGPDVADWLERSRLNLTTGMKQAAKDPAIAPALDRIAGNVERALRSAARLLGEA